MRNFIVSYNSAGNLFKGHVHVSATTVSEAQDKFLNWLRNQPTYAHLWDLSFVVKEIGDSL
jgi:hypothetical protein